MQYRPYNANSGSVLRNSGAPSLTIHSSAGRPRGWWSALRSSRMKTLLDTGFGEVATYVPFMSALAIALAKSRFISSS
jgi:hypothetical protein